MKPIEEIVANTCPKPGVSVLERKIRPHKEQALNCPRCNSTNTKFCYYNNYSLTQPRYFCKTCRRYWTEGGSLRNIPVGGGSRKNKRPSSSSSTISSSNSAPTLPNKIPDLPHQNPKSTTLNPQDLNLAFPSSSHHHQQDHFSSSNNNLSEIVVSGNPPIGAPPSSSQQLSAMELLTGMANSRGLNCFMPMPVPDPASVYTAGFPDLHDQFKPSLGFSLDGYGVVPAEASNGGGRLLQLPFEDLKQGSNGGVEEGKGQQGDSSGYWTGMLGGGSW